MTSEEIKKRIEEHLPDAKVHVNDLTGTGDHWQVVVVSKTFEGKPMIAQHRMIKGFFKDEIAANSVHAFSLQTYTPEEAKKL